MLRSAETCTRGYKSLCFFKTCLVCTLSLKGNTFSAWNKLPPGVIWRRCIRLWVFSPWSLEAALLSEGLFLDQSCNGVFWRVGTWDLNPSKSCPHCRRWCKRASQTHLEGICSSRIKSPSGAGLLSWSWLLVGSFKPKPSQNYFRSQQGLLRTTHGWWKSHCFWDYQKDTCLWLSFVVSFLLW